jgi:hypothetical protein
MAHTDAFGTAMRAQEYVCEGILLATAFYLLAIETTVMYKLKFRYLQSPTKYFNIINPVLILINVFYEGYNVDTVFWRVQSWSALVIWTRFLLYLRSITMFSWLMRMITECIFEMTTFFIVLIFSIITFADAFLSIEKILVLEGAIKERVIPVDANFYEIYYRGCILAWQNSF